MKEAGEKEPDFAKLQRPRYLTKGFMYLTHSSTQPRHEGLKEELNGPSLFDPVEISLFYL